MRPSAIKRKFGLRPFGGADSWQAAGKTPGVADGSRGAGLPRAPPMSRKRAVQRNARRGMRRIEGAAGSPAPRDPLHEGRDPFFSSLLDGFGLAAHALQVLA